jgi:hypothetical protein
VCFDECRTSCKAREFAFDVVITSLGLVWKCVRVFLTSD